MDGALLEQALESGRKRKDAYYAARLAAGSRPPWIYCQMVLAAREKSGVLPYDDLRQFLAEETLDEFFTNALHVGLLDQTKHLSYHYQIPIPSFGATCGCCRWSRRQPERRHLVTQSLCL